MANVKTEYTENTEAAAIASQLVEKYPEVFGALDVANITFRRIMNKERNEKKKYWEVKSVPFPVRIDCPHGYYITMYNQDWAEMDESHRALLVAEALHTIPTEQDKEGKLNTFDIKTFGNMVRTFGVDFMDKSDVPNLLKDTVKWNVR